MDKSPDDRIPKIHPKQCTHVRYGKKYHPVTPSWEITTREAEGLEHSHPVWFNGRFAKNGFPVKDGRMYVILFNFELDRQTYFSFDAPPVTVKTITLHHFETQLEHFKIGGQSYEVIRK